ncbi:MAG: Smr/MutS family protein [Formosimonas sp.]
MKAKSYGLADLAQLKKTLDAEQRIVEQQRAAQKQAAQRQQMLASEFAQAVTQVTPLKKSNTVVHPPRKVKLPEPPRVAPVAPPVKDTLSDGFDARHLRDDELGTYLRQGVPDALLKKLQKGFWPIDLRLDLHGKTAEEARIATSAFLYQAASHKARVISIIHGQGYGSTLGHAVLKQSVRNWLVQNNHVLAFCAAPAAAGGHGAVLILLNTKDTQ